MKRWLELLGWACMLSITVTGVWVYFFDKPWLSYSNVPFPVLSAQVREGDPVRFKVVRCNSSDEHRSFGFSRTMVPIPLGDGRPTYVMPAGQASIRPGCSVNESSSGVVPTRSTNFIPLGVMPGRYYIEGVSEINGNLRTFRVPWRTQPFEVIP